MNGPQKAPLSTEYKDKKTFSRLHHGLCSTIVLHELQEEIVKICQQPILSTCKPVACGCARLRPMMFLLQHAYYATHASPSGEKNAYPLPKCAKG